jgi:hypothetical protein
MDGVIIGRCPTMSQRRGLIKAEFSIMCTDFIRDSDVTSTGLLVIGVIAVTSAMSEINVVIKF